MLHWAAALRRQSFLTCVTQSAIPARETTATNRAEGGFCPQPLLGRLLSSPHPSRDRALDLPTKLHAQGSSWPGCSQRCPCSQTFARPYVMASGAEPDGFPQVPADGGSSHCPSESIRLRSCRLSSASSVQLPSSSEQTLLTSIFKGASALGRYWQVSYPKWHDYYFIVSQVDAKLYEVGLLFR